MWGEAAISFQIPSTLLLYNPQALGFMRLKTIFTTLSELVILLSSYLFLGTKPSAKFCPGNIKNVITRINWYTLSYIMKSDITAWPTWLSG